MIKRNEIMKIEQLNIQMLPGTSSSTFIYYCFADDGLLCHFIDLWISVFIHTVYRIVWLWMDVGLRRMLADDDSIVFSEMMAKFLLS